MSTNEEDDSIDLRLPKRFWVKTLTIIAGAIIAGVASIWTTNEFGSPYARDKPLLERRITDLEEHQKSRDVILNNQLETMHKLDKTLGQLEIELRFIREERRKAGS